MLSGNASTAVAPSSATALRTPCNSEPFCASAMRIGSPVGVDPADEAANEKSCSAHITSLSAVELPSFTPLPQNSCTAVGGEPGVHIKATQRDTAQCAPISFTAVVSTAAAVVW